MSVGAATVFAGMVCPTGKMLAQAPEGGPPGSACTCSAAANSKTATSTFIFEEQARQEDGKKSVLQKVCSYAY